MSTAISMGLSPSFVGTAAPLDPWQEVVVSVFTQFLHNPLSVWKVHLEKGVLVMTYSNDQKSIEVNVNYRSGVLHGTLRRGGAGCLSLDLARVRESRIVDEDDREKAVWKALEALVRSLSEVSPREYDLDTSSPPSPEPPKESMPAPKLGSDWLHFRNIEKIQEALEEEEMLAGIRYIFGNSSSDGVPPQCSDR